jgi:undecaprenyl phosphate N,N'-diacetylbacillosamine 1-phosphate transferase
MLLDKTCERARYGSTTQDGVMIQSYPLTYRFCKRVFDVCSALFGIIVLLPLLPLICVLIKLDSRGPVLFKQQRLGRGGCLFTIYKLRTMAHGSREVRNPDGSQFVGPNDPRLTCLGRFFRDYSIDELPQLVNILSGDMSVVGPRPDVPGAPGLNAEIFQKKRRVRPGLVSLASIKGRNSISWPERVNWELQYVDRASLTLDCEILLKALVVVIRREGVYYPTMAAGTSASNQNPEQVR